MRSATSYSPTLYRAVPSALEGLTSEFGMGSGVPPPPKSLSAGNGSHLRSNMLLSTTRGAIAP